jgi:hypothetical protein
MLTKTPLRDAMLALHDELASLELDIATAQNHPRLPKVVALWERQRASAAQFFDWDVYHGESVAA